MGPSGDLSMLVNQSFQDTEELSTTLHEPSWLKDMRRDAQRSFAALPLPNFRYGMTVRMDISDLKMEEIEPLEAFDEKYELPHLPDGIFVDTINNTAQREPEVLQQHFMKLFYPHQDKFSALHGAFWTQGTFIHVPKNTTLSQPIQLVRHASTRNALHHTLIVAEPGSSVEIVERLSSKERAEQAFYSNVTEIVVKQGARVRFSSVQDYGRHAFCFDHKIAGLAQDSTIEWNNIFLGSRFTRSENTTTLAGAGSSVTAHGLFFGDKEQQFDLGATAVHAAPHTQSTITARGVLNDTAKNIYRGLIRIQRNAAGSNGRQRQDALLLSPRAEQDSIPKLEIDNNDVKCSHAATIGQVDKEKLFYLMARGFSEEAAKKQIVRGFFEPLIKDFTFVDHVRERVEQRL